MIFNLVQFLTWHTIRRWFWLEGRMSCVSAWLNRPRSSFPCTNICEKTFEGSWKVGETSWLASESLHQRAWNCDKQRWMLLDREERKIGCRKRVERLSDHRGPENNSFWEKTWLNLYLIRSMVAVWGMPDEVFRCIEGLEHSDITSELRFLRIGNVLRLHSIRLNRRWIRRRFANSMKVWMMWQIYELWVRRKEWAWNENAQAAILPSLSLHSLPFYHYTRALTRSQLSPTVESAFSPLCSYAPDSAHRLCLLSHARNAWEWCRSR